ncbi:BEN domain-containing protein 5, partial [Stegodyphus mimosarum]
DTEDELATESKEGRRVKASSEKEIPTKCQQKSHFTVPDEKLKLAYLGVKEGSAGDSRYIKNLSLCIFGEEELAQSSVTGRPCNSKRNLDAKPSLCLVKLDYLRELFIQRLKKETPKVTPEEILFRTNKIRPMIAEKIATIVRIKKKNP